MGQVIEASPTDVTAAGTLSAALDVRGLSKHFGGTKALNNVSMVVRKGTVHALLGGNGSGKSTMIKLLAGVYPADSGQVTIFGEQHAFSGYSAATAQTAGLRFVHQDLGLFDDLSIEENFALDAGYPTGFGSKINWRTLRSRVADLLESYEITVDPRKKVGALRPADRTMVAIARALQDQDSDDRILVLDEPTASLANHESSLLLDRVRRRADLGQTVIIVSHRLQEVLSVAHDFTVFRDGQVAGVLVDAQPTEDELIELMAGRAVTSLRPTGSASHKGTDVVLDVAGLRGGPLSGVNLTVNSGEIVGIAGLVGSGRTTLLQSIFGVVPMSHGTMRLLGKPYTPTSVHHAMASGIALVPEDRGREAGFADLSVRDNMALSMLRDNWTRGFMPRSRERSAAVRLIDQFKIRVGGPDALFSSMSGGNQQKVIIARWLQRNPRLLLLDEPTQGVDVMSRADIYAAIRNFAARGSAVVVASSDMSELHALCDRVVVLRSGRVTDQIDSSVMDLDTLNRLLLKDPTGQTNLIRTIASKDRK